MAAVCHHLVEASLHVNAFSFECILSLFHLVQELVREGYVVHVFIATYTLHFQLFSTHMLWVYARMFIQEKELKNYAYAFGFESAY